MARGGKAVLLGALVIIYIAVATHNPPSWFKSLGYNQVLDAYGKLTAHHAPLQWIFNPGLRSIPNQTSSAYALIPNEDNNHQQRIESALENDPLALIESSAVDAWHTTSKGQEALGLIRERAYRAVVFDGGHHLPTLGLEPDVLLIPVLRDTAVHSYMRDGMSVQVLQQLLEKINSPSVAVTVSRWLVVKRPSSLETLTERIIAGAGPREDDQDHGFEPCASPGMSWYNGYIMAYVSGTKQENPAVYAARIRTLNQEIKEVFVAFNYNNIDQHEAAQWACQVATHLGRPVTVVNRPVKVIDLLRGR
ncbi:MAG TPA: hypothetical protein PLM20_01920 [Syntrophomonadaceae bacterium]|mgnify:CR=1 FL=1|nr:hypothetical protein [Syntrophomonadaceae bacterium]HQA06726.1 hypothetical protein [Syntrophomonadaceae bacterium]HQE22641.1 hypothetical protein [Syntrophomonadaceae bacterium]